MSKEWILNIATNRWGLNKKNNVGPVSEWIRECNPKNIKDWENYYFEKLGIFLSSKGLLVNPREYIQELGKKLYIKITEVIQSEIEDIEEVDCVQYLYNLLINRTFQGYKTEINTIYGLLKNELDVEIKPAPDKWDRIFNVDFYIKIKEFYIGLQIKPISYNQMNQAYNWQEWLKNSHKKFQEKYKGKVFIIFSIKRDGKKEIANPEIINDIKKEIQRLKSL
ncbi:MAG: hypothetical protein KatS3mg129_2521 [Leptospiraceae bacterium]|nr:MAG: hypothetical protein KatS3mg129_2521 [Leptospiraceae bacterium]